MKRAKTAANVWFLVSLLDTREKIRMPRSQQKTGAKEKANEGSTL